MSNSPPKHSATLVLGAGELGMSVIRALCAKAPKDSIGDVAVLLRPERRVLTSTTAAKAEELAALGVVILRADLATEDEAALAAIFAPYTTIVCCTGFVGGPGTQRRITKAALLAGVERYVPWQFGVDYDAVGRGSGQDVWDEQLDVRDLLRAQSRTHWTIVSTGMFTSFLFDPAFGIVELDRPRVTALGGWDNEVTVTSPEDVGRLTASILAIRPQLDGLVHVAGETLTYDRLATLVEAHAGRPVERRSWTVPHLQAALSDMPEDDIRKYRLAFARGVGISWPVATTFNAREGIRTQDVASWMATNLGPPIAAANPG